jgi:hypothetical protein
MPVEVGLYLTSTLQYTRIRSYLSPVESNYVHVTQQQIHVLQVALRLSDITEVILNLYIGFILGNSLTFILYIP